MDEARRREDARARREGGDERERASLKELDVLHLQGTAKGAHSRSTGQDCEVSVEPFRHSLSTEKNESRERVPGLGSQADSHRYCT